MKLFCKLQCILPLSWNGSWKTGRADCQWAASLLFCALSRSCWHRWRRMYHFPCLCTGSSRPRGFAAGAQTKKTSGMKQAHSIRVYVSESGLVWLRHFSQYLSQHIRVSWAQKPPEQLSNQSNVANRIQTQHLLGKLSTASTKWKIVLTVQRC